MNNPIKVAQLQIGLNEENWICPPVGATGFCHPWNISRRSLFFFFFFRKHLPTPSLTCFAEEVVQGCPRCPLLVCAPVIAAGTTLRQTDSAACCFAVESLGPAFLTVHLLGQYKNEKRLLFPPAAARHPLQSGEHCSNLTSHL